MPPFFWPVVAFVFGVTIGSFLNVVIWRLPRGESLAQPPSHCPHCNARLGAVDLVPLFSYLLLRGRCRRCKASISPRYFTIELLTGIVFAAIALRYADQPLYCIALIAFAAILIPIYFIDLATFEIHNVLSMLLFIVAVATDLLAAGLHEPGHALLWGWLPASIPGGFIGALCFGAVRVLGWIWKRQEAMGLGDVLLARGMGAMLAAITPAVYSPVRYIPIWIMLSCLSGAVVGPFMLWMRRRAAARHGKADGAADEEEDIVYPDEDSTLGKQLGEIGWCLALGDFVELAGDIRAARTADRAESDTSVEGYDGSGAQENDEFIPAPSAIPFGPFLVIGFLAAVFLGEWLTGAYIRYALGGHAA